MGAASNILIVLSLTTTIMVPAQVSSKERMNAMMHKIVVKSMEDELSSLSAKIEFTSAIAQVCTKKIGDITETLIGDRTDKLPDGSDIELSSLYKASMKICYKKAQDVIRVQLEAFDESGW
ncbi:hypothetical protein J6I92_08170 [Pseudidiomarina sp. 1APR75-15]|uniref:Pectinesterase inhibitor domain-containing protein n=1 Tax=Pseudidiomarina terrestris TaxID=2820060 RepID=A0ABT8MIT8_9GAMM|nr:hypothetical protein [Pseudidiomarina sp. 1APR75-15]MDN7129845.1 hypothetical protein [Pseudidiomarina sp. 1APR75-15]